ncbi:MULTISPECIES: GTP cyclohydrolase FolE2 [Bacillaceae]|uniref:GTP cyclohydrolase FolE2 n=1 Tax=Alkalicoccobacillus plakortidis TaxID=444060 RepID=A0A9D5DMT2_9BACI|nr:MULTISPECIES: GTP cyclohydrolase FolE2 [Bacillaceae]KQL56793.1 GTP cyclohydrolase [Alkalicoccobacillus plakortidis]
MKIPLKAARHALFGSVSPSVKTKPTEKEHMQDLQNTHKDFLFDVNLVGVANVKRPVQIKSTSSPVNQTTVATFSIGAQLNRYAKGTNMSRFLTALEEFNGQNQTLSLASLKNLARSLADRLNQDMIHIHVAFPWFYSREAPTSLQSAHNHSEIEISLNYSKTLGFKTELTLACLVTTLCPCSKEISEYSAHNQRGEVKMSVELCEDFDEDKIDWKNELLVAAESNASARIHPILKRPDEKVVTEQAFENPRFVEDLVRLVAADLYEYDWVTAFKVTCQNQESIHLHDAVAKITYKK